jgi:hypothetical protein
MAKKYISVQWDRERKLRLRHIDFAELETKLGCSLTQLDFEKIRYIDILNILAASLKWDDKEITEDYAMDLFDEYLELKDVYELFGKVIQGSVGSQDPNGQAVVVPQEVNGIGIQQLEVVSDVESK